MGKTTQSMDSFYKCPRCKAERKSYGVNKNIVAVDGFDVFESIYECGTKMTCLKKRANYKNVHWQWCKVLFN